MIDSINLILMEDAMNSIVQMSGRRQIGSERLFNDDASLRVRVPLVCFSWR